MYMLYGRVMKEFHRTIAERHRPLSDLHVIVAQQAQEIWQIALGTMY